MEKQLKSFLDSFIEMGVPGFRTVILKKGEKVWDYTNGYLDKTNKTFFNSNERFFMYSASKPITCVAAMQLWEKGLFSLDDNLLEYIPEYDTLYLKNGKKASKKLKIKHLFSMTSGFSYDISDIKEKLPKNATTLEAVKLFAQIPLEFEPGEKWLYGISHDILAVLIEVITGEKFSSYVENNIFKPLKMDSSTFDYTNASFIAPLYRHDGQNANEIQKNNHFKYTQNYESGGAGLISTVEDYLKFLEALRVGNKIIKKETLQLMTEDCLNKETRKSYWMGEYGYGLGFRCPRKGASPTDFGWAGAGGVFFAVDPEIDTTVFHVQHILNPPNNNIKGKIIHILNGRFFEGDLLIKDVEKNLG